MLPAPNVIGDHGVPNWAEMKRMIKKIYTKAMSLKRADTERDWNPLLENKL